jgi:hypothetical protein
MVVEAAASEDKEWEHIIEDRHMSGVCGTGSEGSEADADWLRDKN